MTVPLIIYGEPPTGLTGTDKIDFDQAVVIGLSGLPIIVEESGVASKSAFGDLSGEFRLSLLASVGTARRWTVLAALPKGAA